MEIEFGSVKDAENQRKHGLFLSLVSGLDWDCAMAWPDTRFPYDEIRLNAIVPMRDRLYFVTYTERGEMMRQISLRCAENAEKKRYVRHYT